MQKFSERMVIKEQGPIIQTDGMNDALRNSLWNLLHSLYDGEKGYWISAAKWSAQSFFKTPPGDLPYDDYDNRKWLMSHFFNLKWYEVYDFIEFIVGNHELMIQYPKHNRTKLIEMFNSILEQEHSGYRFISGALASLVPPAETGEISSAIEATTKSGLAGARDHLLSSLTLLQKKTESDYRKAVKEAIIAVESLVQQLTKSGAQGLPGALEELPKEAGIPGALKACFVALCGYPGDEEGTRQAIPDQPTIGLEEAKYMIVSCSACVNYLLAKAQKTHLLK
jgi:hypothetical protein